MGNNKIYGEIPSSIGQLTNLKILYVFSILKIQIKQLKVLIHNNVNINDFFFILMKNRNLSNNKLNGTIPESIYSLRNLETL